MLRNLNKSAGGRRILGTPAVGLLASQIITETATGDSGPGLLYDEALVNAGKQLRVRVTSLPSAGTLFVHENGAVDFSGAPDGVYTAGYAVDADNVQISTDTATFTVGAVNASATAGTGTSTGTGTGGTAVGQAGSNAAASSGTGTGTGSGTGGDATGQAGTPAVAGSGTGTGTGSGAGGDALGQVAGTGNVDPATGTGSGSGTGGSPTAQASASVPGGAGTGAGSGAGGNATGGALVNAVEPGGTGTGVGSGFGGASGDIGDCRITLTVDRPTRIARAVTDLSVEFSRETIMSSRFVKGEVIRLHALITDDQEQPIDPAVLVLRMRYDNGPETLLTYGADPEITRHTQGRFVADIPLAQGGVFHYRWETSGAADGAAEGSVSVLSGRFS